MGNTQSSAEIVGEATGDAASTRSGARKPIRVLRKSSTNLFKRIDYKSPLPPEMTSTVIHVQPQMLPTNFVEHIDDSQSTNDNSKADTLVEQSLPSVSRAQSGSAAGTKSVSTAFTDDTTLRPLSTSATIREPRRPVCKDSDAESGGVSETRPPYRPTSGLAGRSTARDSLLSPSIPCPSPLPEDSPHKYGLRDNSDTPEVLESEPVKVTKARRRNSGLDIFNEAKSLQSASSFLNGLSTSRRRAESAQRSTDATGVSSWTLASYDGPRPASARLASRPSSARISSSTILRDTFPDGRRRGHNFKPSGFAYTHPLKFAQMKCYQEHARMLPSRNKQAPVECAVCHMDDGDDHFTCTWCALRMCRYCRGDFVDRGMTALKERVKQAEYGSGVSSSSSESLSLRGRARNLFV